ncbi:TonB-dependent receptor [Fluviicola taffensis]|uniref:TonB-dependent receptor n=1 Tax=Fluviicola taffensis (strain DSM 16823 / NCIMB 13979 / RW262) TaxID=755732 RepID=F2IBP9_FLUTR|nr:TonB-dependent receptor [Fluviicola taffensis]AEA45375.1 TonB-dependent receptor [Fluviicola taffensis DSM 16823]
MTRILVLVCICLSSQTLFSQVLHGTVIDEHSKQIIAEASIGIEEHEIHVTTDAEGKFQLNLKNMPQLFHLVVRAPHYDLLRVELIKSKTDTSIVILLHEQHFELEEVEIKSSYGQTANQVVSHVEVRKLSTLNGIPQSSLGDALATIPGVYNSSTGTGIYKPIIRGLSGSRVITYLNGIRLENQQWGGDHGLGITEIGIDQVEVIKGPSSLLYGADALGGILYFSDEKYAHLNKTTFMLQSRFESNSLLTSNTVGFKTSTKKLRLAVYGGYNSAADYQTPDGLYVKNTRYNQKMARISAGFGRKNYTSNIRYSLLMMDVGIPGHSHDSIPDPADFYGTKAVREKGLPYQHIFNQIISWENKFFFKKHEFQVLLGNTHNQLQEYEEKVTIPGMFLQLNTTSYQVKHKVTLRNQLELISGVQGMVQLNKNNPDAEEILIPNATTMDNGIYTVLNGTVKKTTFQLGLRMDVRHLKVQDDSIQFNNWYPGFTYSAGIVQRFKNSKLRINLSSGFRAPHSSELLANGVHHGTMRFEIGNRDLKTEQANQIDLTYEYDNEHISFIVNPFYSYIQHFIYIEPSDSFAESLPVYYYKSATSAQLYGIDAGIHLHPHFAHGLHLESTYSLVYGIINNNYSMPLVPPGRIQTNLRFAFNSKRAFKFDEIIIQHAYYFPQNNVFNYETRTVDYHVLDAGLKFSFTQSKSVWGLQAGVKNCLNTRYVPHISRLKTFDIPSPGINGYIVITYNLK